MGFKKNQEIFLVIEDFTREGEGLGKLQGFPFFVKDTVIGDKVRASITKLKKHYGYARLIEVIEPSPDRVEAPCPVARQCGGCRIQQLSYKKQLDFKWKLVADCLSRIGGFEYEELTKIMEPEVIGMDNPWHYRNKAQFPVGTDKNGHPIAGFYAGRTHRIIPNTDCLIQAEVNQQIMQIILNYMEENRVPAYDEKTHTGLIRHVLTRVGFASGQIMVCLVLKGSAASLPRPASLIDPLTAIPGMTSIIVNTNKEKTNKITGNKNETIWGKDYIEDYIDDIRYQIGPLSFFQVNPVQTKKLYRKVLEYADLHGTETVWDLYCGIGSISLFFAQKARHVYGVEIVPEAVRDARINAKINHLDHAVFFEGKAEEILVSPDGARSAGKRSCSAPGDSRKTPQPPCRDDQKTRKLLVDTDTWHHPDVIVVDPPRKGCDSNLLDTMLLMRPSRIVYVSCDPATLARDLKILCGGAYQIEKLAVVDQFAHSCHVETVVLLDWKGKEPRYTYFDYETDHYHITQGGKATYEEIKAWVKKNYGLKVSSLYIGQIKSKCGLKKRDNYNMKSENGKVPICPPEKEEAIRQAFKHFGLI